MCGICGLLALEDGPFPSEAELHSMANALSHRGPDDEGYYLGGPAGFGFRRLSIVDLVSGHQPMTNEDGTLQIIFNGEIYNHLELRPQLEGRGHRYATTSDTETILHLYEEYGSNCVRHLRGMFAFAIWDSRKRRLFCARDRLGIKPLYYTRFGGRFAFASEIKAFLELPGFRAKLNRQVLPEFFAFGYLSSDETLFDGVRKLMPGHWLSIDLAGPQSQEQITRYWDLDLSPDENLHGEADFRGRFEELFAESIRIHLMSDVPLGVFLSGGLDSSAIAAVMSGLRQDQIKTFSVGYVEDQFSELPYARLLAKHVGAEYNEIILGPEKFLASLPELIWHEDEPIVWPSSVALHFVSRLASEKVKVVLTGEGADEIFAGYLKYRVTLWNHRYGPLYRKLTPNSLQKLIRNALGSELLPDAVRRKLRHSFLYYPAAFEKIYFDNFYCAFPQEQQPRLFTQELSDDLQGIDAYASAMRLFPGDGGNEALLNRLLYLDIKTYLVELLMKQDQMSMAASIESRVPFLDHKLVEFAARIPAQHKVKFLSAKRLLRSSMEKKLPPEILYRHKKGFPTPIKPWLRNQLFERLRSILTDGRLAERRLLNPEYVSELVEGHRRGQSDATEACWRLLNFELWNRIFIDGESAVHRHAVSSLEVASRQ